MDALRDEIMFPNLHSSDLKIDLSWLSNTSSWFHYFKTLQKQYLNKCQYFTVGVYYNLLNYSSSSLRRKSTNFHGSGSQLWCQDFLRLMFTNSWGLPPPFLLGKSLEVETMTSLGMRILSHQRPCIWSSGIWFFLYTLPIIGDFQEISYVVHLWGKSQAQPTLLKIAFLFRGLCTCVCVCVCGWSTKLKIPNLPLNSILFLWNLIQDTIRRF